MARRNEQSLRALPATSPAGCLIAVEPLNALLQGIVLVQQVAQDEPFDPAQRQAQRIARRWSLWQQRYTRKG